MNRVATTAIGAVLSEMPLLTISQVDVGPGSHVWPFLTIARRYGKTYQFTAKVDLTAFELDSSSWMVAWLSKMHQQSCRSAPFNSGDIQKFILALRRLSLSATAKSMARVPVAALTREGVHSLFFELEELLAKDENLVGPMAMSNNFRRYFWSYAHLFGLNPRITRESTGFRTRFSASRKRKPLLGDFSDVEPALGATEFTTYSDLKAKIKIRAEGALAEVQKVFVAEIEIVAKLRAFLEECANLPIDIDVLMEVQKYLGCSYRGRGNEWLLNDIESLIGAIVICIRANGMHLKDCDVPEGFVFPKQVRQYISKKIGWQDPGRYYLYCLEFALMDEISASCILIQSIGGWNPQVALELDLSQLTYSDDQIIIRGYKGRTDSDTPELVLEVENVSGRQAVELLSWNHQRLVELGYKNEFDQKLFRVAKCNRSDGMPEIQHCLSKWRTRHGEKLKGFKLGVLRRQRLFIEGLTSVENAQTLAGHISLATTSIYLDTEVAHRLNSAISLKMKRRLEGELLYAIGLRDEKPEWPLMLTPIGDGSSCSDPANPPSDRETENGICRALACHSGDGCANNRLVIDRDRMREAVAVKNMYLKSWKRLHARNPALFSSLHVPNIIFNSALLKLIGVGPHAHVLREIENELQCH